MKPELERLARHRLGRAKAAFSEGDHLLNAKAFMGAVNRFYYAAFYAVRELDSSRHSGVISLFQAQFVKPGLIPTEKAKALPRAFEKRQKSDYGDFSTVTATEAQAIRKEVSDFLEACEQVLDRLIAEP
ncbi:MAG: HEPN domain-containing protein [Candidatus Binatia bacterium]|nr:HEPN domain-containing protein [Candidatus Binatia bacterium]